MKKIITILLLITFTSQGQTISAKSVLTEVRNSLKSCKVVYFTSIEKVNNEWCEIVERLFIKKGSKLTKTLKERLKGPGEFTFKGFKFSPNSKPSKRIVFIRSSGKSGSSKRLGMYITNEKYLELLNYYKYEEHQQRPN